MPPARKKKAAPKKAPARKRAPKTEAAEAFDVTEVLSGYDDRYLICRDLRHAWQVVGYYDEGGFVKRRLACERCPVQRTDRLRRNGAREHPSYDYPSDYQLKGMHVTAADVVTEVLQRVDVYGNEAQLLESMFTTNGRRKKR